MTSELARELGRCAGAIGAPDRIPDELVVELSDDGIFAYHEGHAQGLANRAFKSEGVSA